MKRAKEMPVRTQIYITCYLELLIKLEILTSAVALSSSLPVLDPLHLLMQVKRLFFIFPLFLKKL